MVTYEVKRPGREHPWIPAGEDMATAEEAMRSLNDRAQSSTLVWLRNNFNGSVAVFEVGSIGPVGYRGSYGAFYGTDQLPTRFEALTMSYSILRVRYADLRRGDRFVTVPAEVGVNAPPFAGPPITAVKGTVDGAHVTVSTVNGGLATHRALVVALILRPDESTLADAATWEPDFPLPMPDLPA